MKYYSYYDNMVKIPPKPIKDLKEREEIKLMVKSCILTRKNGMPISDLRDEFQKITGEDIPYLKLGYYSIFHLVRDIPDISPSKNEAGEHVLVVKPNAKTQHIHNLIAKQKDPKVYTVNKDSRRRDRNFREKRIRQKQHDLVRNMTFGHSDKLPPLDEINDRPVIYTTDDVDEPICTSPIIGNGQLMGDDFMLQLCIRYLPGRFKRKDAKSAITMGTVQSGLTIKKAVDRLNKVKVISNKMVINLGAVDIYRRRSSKDMIKDYKSLLCKLRNTFNLSPEGIVLCTIPPLGNINIHGNLEQFVNLQAFNNWIRDLAVSQNYKLIDFHDEFTNANKSLNYDLFQQDARMVSGTIHPHLLWNYFGRQKAMRLLLNA